MDKTLFLKEADRMAASERNTVLSPDTSFMPNGARKTAILPRTRRTSKMLSTF